MIVKWTIRSGMGILEFHGDGTVEKKEYDIFYPGTIANVAIPCGSHPEAVDKEVIMMEMEVFRLADLATSFATRMKAREVAELLSNRVQNTKGDAVVVDWNGVNAVSPSFIDEFIGEIGVIMQNQSRGRSIVFAGTILTSLSLLTRY